MADVVAPEVRSRMMSGIRGKNTKPEILIRKALHARRFRYRLHSAALPGKPDLVFPRFQAVIFVHGCYWHGHDCPLFRLPATRTEFWAEKIEGNRQRDTRVHGQLLDSGWRVFTVHECAIKGPGRIPVPILIDCISDWLQSSVQIGEIEGRTDGAGGSHGLDG